MMAITVPNFNNVVAGAASSVSDDSFSSLTPDAYIHLMLGPWKDLKRPWLVQSESNVRRSRRKVPDPPCTVCKGAGHVTCKRCKGRGRTNFVELAMLPKGEWPIWCGDCKGSGLDFCDRCLGSGERKGILGFHIQQDEDMNGTSGES